MDREDFDHVVLGAGLAGLGAALRLRREHPHETLLLLDAAPRAGGVVATQRSNGFVCELGPFAFGRAEIEPLLCALTRPPTTIEPLPAGRTGAEFDGRVLVPIAIDPLPVSFTTGNEELIQACRRELGPLLRLGRAATALRPGAAGCEIDLGGEAPGGLRARRVTLALPTAATARLLLAFDRELQRHVDDLGEPRAFVFFGGHGGDAPELRGYGIVPATTVASPCAEVIFCTQVFANRALPGRFLVRMELGGEVAAADDAAVRTAAEAELRRWTGTRAPLPFTKVHRFRGAGDPAAAAEASVRLAAAAARFATLTLA